MYVGLVSRIADEVMEVKRFSGVPPVLTICSLVATGPVVACVAITWTVLLVHVEPQALHGVSVQDVSKAEDVAKLRGLGEVGAVVPALGPVHHQGVAANIGPAPALSAPVGRGISRGQNSLHLVRARKVKKRSIFMSLLTSL